MIMETACFRIDTISFYNMSVAHHFISSFMHKVSRLGYPMDKKGLMTNDERISDHPYEYLGRHMGSTGYFTRCARSQVVL